MLGSAGFVPRKEKTEAGVGYRDLPDYPSRWCSMPTSDDCKYGIRGLTRSITCVWRIVTFARAEASNLESCGHFFQFSGRCFKLPCLQCDDGKNREWDDAQHTTFAADIGMIIWLALEGTMANEWLLRSCEGW